MNKEDIIRMAKQAGYYTDDEDVYDGSNFFIHTKEITKFAELVAAHVKSDQINTAYQQGCEDMKRRMEKRMQQLESQLQLCQTAVADEREACAKVCEERADSYKYATDPWAHEHISEANTCAAAIRARGEK